MNRSSDINLGILRVVNHAISSTSRGLKIAFSSQLSAGKINDTGRRIEIIVRPNKVARVEGI